MDGIQFNASMLQSMVDMLVYWVGQYGLRLVVALILFWVGFVLSRRLSSLVGRLMEKGGVDVILVSFVRNALHYLLVTAVGIAALGQLGINVTSFLAVLGAAGLAVGLALKDSLSNFAAGVLLIFFRFFRVGDYVTVGGTSGTVMAVNLFNTELATPDNQKVYVPNSSILGNVIVNVTANDTRRIDLVVGIGYGDIISKAKGILEGLLAADERILKEPEPMVAVSELGDSSVNFVVRPWVRTDDYWSVRFDLIRSIKETFDEQGVTIPFPQQDVHLFTEK
ncbi:small conductance mechanosensitive channel [Paucidesulfovibrio gracilis DSM 16080]|uniref:Small conductance mechanosensitive channel n=1 Tax=Paucidesulfovibrio gracilis DSM 16080 TaxID=1121449 RepID=A0A1T4XAV2_9BACT|nr:mechanosensitive ion channel domain-containing protein [Paucidesulfovibrio gracilis]SKA86762.1 small conductance mechanosensitive channel [Paucidesulfovibrio gracilis DSM 16080]